jgi:hypothetical protein
VLTCPRNEECSLERSCTGISRESSEIPTTEPASQCSSSPSVSSISTTLYSDGTTVDSAMTTQESSSSSSSISKHEIDSSGGAEDKSSNCSIHTETEPEPESTDTESHTEVTSDSLSVSVDYINVENISSFHGNDFEKKLPSNGHCNSSRTEPELNSAFIDYYSDHLPIDSKCSEGHEKCHALFALTRSQRTIIELAEVGLLHAFDCDEAVLEEPVESDLRSHFYDGEDADVRTSPCEISYVTRDWSSLPMRLERDRVDDDICLTIRYMVRAPLILLASDAPAAYRCMALCLYLSHRPCTYGFCLIILHPTCCILSCSTPSYLLPSYHFRSYPIFTLKLQHCNPKYPNPNPNTYGISPYKKTRLRILKKRNCA